MDGFDLMAQLTPRGDGTTFQVFGSIGYRKE
jgi:hypothetical protein